MTDIARLLGPTIRHSQQRQKLAAGGGAFGTLSPAEEAERPRNILDDIVSGGLEAAATLPRRAIENSAYSLDSGTYDPSVPMEAALGTFGTGAGARGGLRPVNPAARAHVDPPAQLPYNPDHGVADAPAQPVVRAEAPVDVGGGLAGPLGGGESLQQAELAAQRRASGRQPLPGLPTQVQNIEGQPFSPGPVGSVHDVADAYMAAREMPSYHKPPEKYHDIDKEHSAAIARAFDEMEHAPNDPAVKASYEALINETLAQYQAIKASGLKITPVGGADYPYSTNPRAVARDVADNNHMAFFKTSEGFGSDGLPPDPHHPMMRSSGEKIGEHDMLNNDIFRVVHDYFGHIKNGYGFRATGEDNAWRAHAAMYSDIARPAMTTETRGQNSWVNYGPHGEANRSASGADTIYADQKVGLMPEWTMRDRGSPDPVIAYQGSAAKFDKHSPEFIGTGEGNQAYGQGLYFAGHEPVGEWYRHQLSARRDPLLSKYGLDSEDGANLGMRLASKKGDIAPVVDGIQQEIMNLKSQGDSKAVKNMIARREGMVNFLRDPERNKGHMYQVAIDHPPEKFLDYDKPLTEQSKAIQDWIAAHPHAARLQGPDMVRGQLKNPDGQAILSRLRAVSESPEQELHRAGIPGIRYLDQGSRSLGNGTHNYVTFDAPRMLKRYAEGGKVDVERLLRPTIKASQQRKKFAEGGDVIADDMIEQARAQLATQPERMRNVLPDVGEPLIGNGGVFSPGAEKLEENLRNARLAKNREGMPDVGSPLIGDGGQFSPGTKIGNRLFGTGTEERFQTWPEKMTHSGTSLAGDILSGNQNVLPPGLRRADYTDVPPPSGPTEDSTWLGRKLGLPPVGAQPNDQMMERAQDMAGLAGGQTLLTGAREAVPAAVGPQIRIRPLSLAADSQATGAPLAALEHAPKFYSHLEQVVEATPITKATGEQWLGTLTNKGVKSEEMDWTGLRAYLAENTGKPVTKAQVQEHLGANKLELGEVNKGHFENIEENPRWQKLMAANEALGREEGRLTSQPRTHETQARIFDIYDEMNANHELMRVMEDRAGEPTKFHGYQLPGGENYREKLLTLPEARQMDPTTGRNLKADQIYRSRHWDEPNVLAHRRTNEREVNGHPSLHIEEIQSDWHQAGRKRGYGGDDLKPGWRLVELETPGEFSLYGPQDTRHPIATGDRAAVMGAAQRFGGKQIGVPDAPFKKNWHELALKDAIREAAEKGLDRISWTAGEAQAARYDLSKHLNEIVVVKDRAGPSEATWWPKDTMGRSHGSIRTDADGNIIKAAAQWGDVAGKNIADVVGKDVAERGLNSNQVETRLSGVDLQVGGDGMKGFYDKMIPDALNKIGKPHGVKVEKGTLPPTLSNKIGEAPIEQPVHYMDIPQSLKDQALKKGFSLFEDSAKVGAPLSALERAAQQGYNIDAYHGTSAPPFEAFKRKPNDIGTHFGTADQANDRLSYMAERRGGDQHVYPVKLKVNNPLRLNDLGGWGSDNLFYGLGNVKRADGTPLFDKEELRRAAYSAGNEAGRTKALRELIERKGYDGIVYKNTGETGGSEPYRAAVAEARAKVDEAFGGKKYSFTVEDQKHPAYQELSKANASYDRHRQENAQDSYIAFHPNQVRSQFAEFDPKNAKKGGLLLEDSATAGAPLSALEHATENARISTRLPTGKKNPENALADDRLKIDMAAMQKDPDLFAHNVGLVSQYPNLLKKETKGKPTEVARRFIDYVKDNLLHLYDQVPENIRARSKLWYEGGNKIVNDFATEFNAHPNSSAGVVAALSPQKDWFQNVDLARRVHDIHYNQREAPYSPEMATTAKRIYKKPEFKTGLERINGKTYGELDDIADKAMWLRLYDEAHNPRTHRMVTPEGEFGDVVLNADGKASGTGWGSLVMIGKAIQALEANGDVATLSRLMGERHKVRNFYNNLIDPHSPHGDVTVDTHAVAAGLMRPLSGNSTEVAHNFGNYPGPDLPTARSSAVTGVGGTYALYADAYREAAKARGILPREMQSITWEAIRGLFQDTWKSSKKNTLAVDNIWRKYQKGLISKDDARTQITELAGGIDPPSWHEPAGGGDGRRSAHDEAGRNSADPAELPDPGVSGRDAEALVGGAGSRAAARPAPALNQQDWFRTQPAKAEGGAVGDFAPRQPQGYASPLPNVSFESRGPGRPQLRGGLSLPVGGGELGVDGGYQRRDEASPAEWSAMVNYRKRFAEGGDVDDDAPGVPVFDPTKLAAVAATAGAARPPATPVFDPMKLKAAKGSMSATDVFSGAVENAPESAWQFAKDVVRPITHPIETATGIKDLGLGLLEKSGAIGTIFPSAGGGHEKYADAMMDYIRNRYGGMENIKRTVAKDPVGALSDASMILTGGGSAGARLPGVMGKVGEVVGNVGRAVDPLMAIPNAAKVGTKVIGETLTHTGATPLENAYRAGVEGGDAGEVFRSHMRGTADSVEPVEMAKRGLAGYRAARGAAYREGMGDITSIDRQMGPLDRVLDFGKIENAVDKTERLHKFGVMDINQPAAAVRNDMMGKIAEWKALPPLEYHTLEGLDALKKSLGQVMMATEAGSPARTAAGEIYNAVRKTIVEYDPKYAKVMEDYEKASTQIKELEKAMSLGQKATADTALRKLQSIMRNNVNTNYGRRLELGKLLEENGATHLMAALSGQSLNAWFPRGLGKLGAEFALLGGAGHFISPWTLASVPLMSPRIMGEVSHGVGRTVGRGLNVTGKALSGIGGNRAAGNASYRLGRATNPYENEDPANPYAR